MTRPQHILNVLLDVLAEWESPADEAVLHAQVNSDLLPAPKAELSEYRHALKTAENEGWISQIPSTRRGMLWSITNKGRAERQA